MRQQPRLLQDWPFIAAAAGAGILLRLIWLSRAEGPLTGFHSAGEATAVAITLARTGVFGGSFHPGYGPTAHLTPISPSLAAGIMAMLGVDTPAANIALLCWALAQVAMGWWLLLILFRRLGADRASLRSGLAVLAIVPVFMGEETIAFRYWEGALTQLLVVANLILLFDAQGRAALNGRWTAMVAALTAVTFFISPPAGLAVNLCWAIWAVRTLPPARVARFAAACTAMLAVIVAPWAMRNAAVMGEPVLLRSNAGLELAIGNHPAALSDRPADAVYAERLLEIQPLFSAGARARIGPAGGEIAYARSLGQQAAQWIAEHPMGFVQLSMRHLRQFFFPQSWQLMFGQATARAAFMGMISAIGLAGLAIALWQRRPGYWMIAVYLGTVALPYAVVQPIQRYSYLIYGILVMLAAELVVRLVRALVQPEPARQ